MQVIEAGQRPGRSERALVHACADLPGLLVLNPLVTDARATRVREVDALLIHPRGVFCIEVKGTVEQGTIIPSQNSDWTIDGRTLTFNDNDNPLRQARTGAQVLAQRLKQANLDAGFIAAVVAVSGSGVTLTTARYADTWTTTCENVPEVLQDARPTVTAGTALALCELLGVEADAQQVKADFLGTTSRTPGPFRARPSSVRQASTYLQEAATDLPAILIPLEDRVPNPADCTAALVTPHGLFVIRVLATHHRGQVKVHDGRNVTVGGESLRAGPASAHARCGRVRRAMRAHDVDVRLSPVLLIASPRARMSPVRSSGAWVGVTHDLAKVVLRGNDVIDLATATAICAALGHPVDEAQLLEAGFVRASEETAPAPAISSADPPAADVTGTTGGQQVAAAVLCLLLLALVGVATPAAWAVGAFGALIAYARGNRSRSVASILCAGGMWASLAGISYLAVSVGEWSAALAVQACFAALFVTVSIQRNARLA